ncbi:MAG TPA: PIN domain-containing protein [Acidimicrobiia bacterium]|nr:PIN domain-containing protein [Acidimicrobiia bacterium]
MARILLDTTVIIDALRGLPAAERVREMRRKGDEPWICAVNVEEIWRGLFADEEPTAARLLRAMRLAPLGLSEGVQAGRWRREHAERGVTLHQADCLIAAAAVSVRATLATGNPDHFPMPELTVDYWPPGS